MNKKTKKIISIFAIGMLVMTVAASTASAFGWFRKTDYNDLVDKWSEIQTEKQKLCDMAEDYGLELADLTYRQKREVLRTAHLLKRDGANREQIRDEMVDMLIDFGVDLPDLTDSQRSEIKTKIKTMLVDDYGFVFVDLTDGQKQEIKDLIKDMKQDDASEEQIKSEVKLLYESYGGVIPELSEVEKEQIHTWIHDMLEADYDLDLPDLTYEQRQNLKNQKNEIKELQKELRDLLKDARFFTKYRFVRHVRRNHN